MRAHRNLHSLRRGSTVAPWVVKDGTEKHGAHTVILHGVTMHHPGDQVGARRCRGELPPYVNPKTGVARKAERAVFAWLNADTHTEQATTPPPHAERLRLNPFTDAFFNVAGQRVDRADTAWLCADGSAWVVV
jgi:hypothetical protein